MPLTFYIMPRYGLNLQQILDKCEAKLPEASIYQIGLSLLNTLELIHNSGFVYNDLKPDNILIGDRQNV